ncbi:dephospho-CoA kinase [Allostreptomyces psammosilenae]|uniref:Dephospho-CoA kinase n=1 Tax=Allostreptomyces psammosilenae TaxID=1892865 RepID=A0A852ZXS1_9ACTN|nr:dephospho-CoA kinase [Allostreptomyces psammosilenae]NYI07183.1 dephospho-CoA kinase [Allostreptomyces psammosilenae]
MLSVGLTGGVGSGKSAVSALLAEHGAVVIDADRLAREVVEPGTEGLAEIVTAFGPGVLRPDGSLDRPALAARVFGDEEQRRRLNGIVHPRVRARAAELQAAAPADAVVVQDIPLLVESGLAPSFDVVVVVDAAPETQLDRLVRLRGMAEADARARIAAQATRQERRRVADLVIDNDGPLEELPGKVAEVWRELCRRASAGERPADAGPNGVA